MGYYPGYSHLALQHRQGSGWYNSAGEIRFSARPGKVPATQSELKFVLVKLWLLVLANIFIVDIITNCIYIYILE